GLVVEDLVRPRHAAVRPEVRQQRELEALLQGPDLVGVDGDDADREDLDGVVGEVGQVVPDGGQFAAAGAGERQRVEDQEHRLAAVEVGQAYVLVVLVLEGEVRCPGPDVDRHGHTLAMGFGRSSSTGCAEIPGGGGL